MQYEKKSLIQMARGAFLAAFDAEMAKVMDNILDPDTKPTGKRKLTMTFTFAPDNERQTIGVSFRCKSKLEPVFPAETALYVTGDPDSGEVSAVEMVPQIPGQMDLDMGEQEAPAALKVIKCS